MNLLIYLYHRYRVRRLRLKVEKLKRKQAKLVGRRMELWKDRIWE